MFLVSVLLVAMATANVLADPVNRQSVLTFNTMLYEGATPAVDNVERRTAIINSIRDIDADVVCLQEVWQADDLEEITQSLSGVYGHSYSLLHQTGEVPMPEYHQTPAACPTCAFHALVNCALMNGCIYPSRRVGGYRAVAMTCMFQHCIPQFLVLPQKCLSCINFIGYGTDLPDVEAKCAGDPAVGKPNLNDPGLVLLSKNAMDSPTYVDYHPGFPQGFRRGYINANIAGMGDVTCTQLTFVTPIYFEFHLIAGGQFKSYEEQSIDEIGKLISFVTSSAEPHVVLGDFNTGPASHDCVTESEGHYEMLTDNLETQLVNSCTFCSYNPYVHGYPNVAIDHIFVRNQDRLMKVDRVLDDETVPSSELPLSDHYGVYGTIKWMKPSCAAGLS